ncbi:SCO6745 family protein [Nocardioides donggukensis]|uniref:SalK n=1 Tax=Nocardioides donggukensis TaxID=2774019 RepID=A0A927K5K7_9ACTN|nr:hypothetical protein [Nocardioides donggukensis]MBD8868271.1 hypothetical protein [Nocardioides donggukensis]
MDPRAAGRLARSLETLHALGYFAPDVEAELVATGLKRGRMTYFASRSAPMGRVGAGPVAAAFFVFSPSLVARFLPEAWESAGPEEVTAARYRGVSAAWHRLLGADLLASGEVAEAADLAREAAQGCTVAGRPLYAAHADLAWPSEPHLVLFHALTLLREHRGDGHVAALLSHGLTGLEALVTHTATGRGFTVPAAQATRGWSPEAWDAAVAGLTERGVMTSDGELTDDGVALRRSVERATDEMAAAPWAGLGEQGATRLGELGKPLVMRALAAGAFPDGVFA